LRRVLLISDIIMISLYGQTAAGCMAIMRTQRWGVTVRPVPAAGGSVCRFKKIKVVVSLEILLFSVLQPGQLRGTDRPSALCSCHTQAALVCRWEREHHHFPQNERFPGGVFSVISLFLTELKSYQTCLEKRFVNNLQIPRLLSVCPFIFAPVAELKIEHTMKQRQSV